MAIRDILIIPDKRLRLKSEPVTAVDKSVRALVDDMLETMYDAPGIGLAAIQIGVPQRVVTMDLAKKDEPTAPQVFINPEMPGPPTRRRSTRKAACRSRNITRRSSGRRRCKVKYLDLDGKAQEIEAERAARDLPAARDRPSQRRLVHRPYLQAQARHGDEEVQEGGEEARRAGQAAVRGQRAFASYRLMR